MSDLAIPTSVVERIRKLLAMAADTRGNENETAVAAEKAQALLTEYNLTLTEVASESATPDASREKNETFISANKQWQADLMNALARNNFCMHWVNNKMARRPDGTGRLRMRARHALVGRRANVAVTLSTYEYLLQAMDRLCPYEDKRTRAAISWFQGCVDRLSSRLAVLRMQAEAASRAKNAEPSRGDGTSLVLADVYSSEEDLNNDLRYNYTPGTTARRRMESAARWAEMRNQVAPVSAPRTETAEERRKREAADARWQAKWERRQAREEARVDRVAYAQGSAAGRDIGLDRQVKADPKKAIC